MKAEVFAGKYHMPDSEDPDTVSHFDWYEATGFKVPFPGEKKVRPASDFNNAATHQSRRRRLNRVPAGKGPLSDNRGEGFLFTPQTQSPHRPESAPPPA